MATLWDATDTPYTDTDIVEYPSVGAPKWRPPQQDPPRVPADATEALTSDCQTWHQAYTIPGGPGNEGRWYLQMQIDETYMGGFADGGNFFAIQARKAGSTAVCDRRIDATCPGVFARDWLPIRAALENAAWATTEIYLAEIDPVHSGKTLEVKLFDPGEGMDYLRILDPAGNPLEFEYTATGAGGPTTPTPNFLCGTPATACLDVEGTGHPLASPADWADNPPPSYRFQGRTVTLKIKLDGIDWGDHWFRVEYVPRFNASGAPQTTSDITSWSVRVIGDPIRLTE